jgi:hypothetical protein
MQGKNFDIPVFEWFGNGGKYSGCKRFDDGGDFNYRITPNSSENRLEVDLWRGVLCFEKTPDSEKTDTAEFPLSEEGLSSAIKYIDNSLEKITI